MKKVPFSPPDITESEVNLVSEALRSGWITTGPKTKEFERLIAMCCQTEQAVCLNSATACMELILRVLDVGPGDVYRYRKRNLSCRGKGCHGRYRS